GEPDSLLEAWAVVICRYLRATRPGEFSPDPGEYDFPPLPDEERRRLNTQRGTEPFDWNAAAAARVAQRRLGPVGTYPPDQELTHARAQVRVWAEVMRAAANLIADVEKPDEGPEQTQQFTAAADYTWVKWPSGTSFHFPDSMQKAVGILCKDYAA